MGNTETPEKRRIRLEQEREEQSIQDRITRRKKFAWLYDNCDGVLCHTLKGVSAGLNEEISTTSDNLATWLGGGACGFLGGLSANSWIKSYGKNKGLPLKGGLLAFGVPIVLGCAVVSTGIGGVLSPHAYGFGMRAASMVSYGIMGIGADIGLVTDPLPPKPVPSEIPISTEPSPKPSFLSRLFFEIRTKEAKQHETKEEKEQ